MSRYLHLVSLFREAQVNTFLMLSKALLLPWSEPEKYDFDSSVQVTRDYTDNCKRCTLMIAIDVFLLPKLPTKPNSLISSDECEL